jgi:tetraacyldisaccharide 4'-kinase
MTAIFDYLNPYAYGMRLRRRLYERGTLRSSHPGVPVISVGNLSLGGTGKSPMVLAIARHLMEQRKRVAIVSRGYKRRSKGFVLVSDARRVLAKVEDSGDEAQMFAQLLPGAIVIVCEDRARGAAQAKRLGAQVIVLDDGFQHLRVQRDLNILLIDCERPLSAVIPFGRFREPFSAVRAADAVVFTNANDKSGMRNHWDRLKPYLRSNVIAAAIQAVPHSLEHIASGESLALDELRAKRVVAFSSIASPGRFHRMLEALGAEVIARELGDHAEYTQAFATTLMRDAERSGAQILVTTMKDAVKCRRFFEDSALPVLVLQQELEFLSGEQSLYDAIDRKL